MDPELAGQLEVPEHPEAYGGYADIYHGVWISPEGQRVEVAVKALKDLVSTDRQTDPAELIKRRDTRMKREVFVWRQMEHPNLHPLLGYRSQPQPQLISPWCRHGNLTSYLGKTPHLSRLAKLRLIFQAACGLEHLHAQIPSVCHADIKPENVLVNDFAVAALSDFGLSRVLDAVGGSGFTTSECAKGTYNYIAPELFNEEKPRPTLMTDVYAFGGLILTVMSGKPPFCGLHHPAILYRVVNDQPPKSEDHQDLPISDPLWGLMRRCWNKSPGARPPMQEVLRELWGEICKEEVDLRSKPSGSCHDDADLSYMDIDTPLPFVGPVTENDSRPSTKTAGGSRHIVSEEAFIQARKILDTLVVDAKIIPVIGGYVAAATDVGSILLGLASTMDRNERMAMSIGLNALRLINHLEQLRDALTMRQGEGLAARVASVQRELQNLQEAIEKWCSSGVFLSAFSCCGSAEGLKQCEGAIKRVQDEIRLLVALETTKMVIGSRNTEMQKEHRRLLDRLGNGYHGVMGNAIEDVTCLPGTRVEILQRIDDWVRGTSGSERALWIRGMAGRGKSTIASTVAHNWRFRASCAIFHYRRGQDALNAQVVCALARQLGNGLVAEVRNAVMESIQENDDIANQHLSEQFSTLLVATLRKLNKHPYPVLIIVDALDECRNHKDVVDFVRLIHRHSSSFPVNVKFLLTCRPEAALLRALEPNNWDKLDLDLTSGVSNDVTRFIYHACTKIRDDHALPESWPSLADLACLVDMSQGLFQWARTAITYISNGSPVDRLRGLLRRPATWSGLDELYHQILSKAMDNMRHEPQKRRLLCSILGTLVVAPYPVSLEVVATLHGDSDIFEGMEQANITQFIRLEILVDVNSLLHIPTSTSESVRFMHTSVRDLLVSKERCQGLPCYVEATQYHQQLASLSLGLMLQLLRENICGLSNLSQAVSEIQGIADREVPKALQYSCQAWSVHLTEGPQWSESSNDVTRSQLDDFELLSRERVLPWIEVMSVIGATSEAIIMAKRVHHWLRGCSSEMPGLLILVDLWNDVHRFIAAFLEPISFGPLHIYASALSNCPQKTELYRLYSSRARVRILGSLQLSAWPSNVWTRSPNGYPKTVAFSVDGSLVISVSNKREIQFWDTETGRQVGEPLTDHGDVDSGTSFCVSPDGRIRACGFRDNTIRLWDSQTEMQLGEPLTGHSNRVERICFSPDGRVLASVSRDATIRLWDLHSGRQSGILPNHSVDPLNAGSLCFSPDGKVLAFGFNNWWSTIQLWDLHTCRQLGELQAPPWQPFAHKSVCFSPDGKVLASGCYENVIQLWDLHTWRKLGTPLTGHSNCVTSLCFSPDGKVLASGSGDRTIRLWDPHTGWRLGKPLMGHNETVVSICFSPDGRVLASGSSDDTIRLWEPQIGTELEQHLTGRNDNDCFQSIGCLPDGGVLAWESEDKTTQVGKIGRHLGKPLTDGDGDIASVCFSPDGRVLASASWKGVIQLWDAHTGMQLGRWNTHDFNKAEVGLRSVRFSPDGRVLASVLDNGRIQLWNPQTGKQFGEQNTTVNSLCFTPNRRVLASGYGDKTIRLVDHQTGEQLGEPQTGHNDKVRSVCFSPDGRLLASESDDDTIQPWDPQTGRQPGEPLAGHSNSFWSVCFLRDCRTLVSGSEDGTVRLWDTQTRMQVDGRRIPHSDHVASVCFSPDRRISAFGFEDCTIRLWDTQTRGEPGHPLLDRLIHSFCFSPDSKVLASGCFDNLVRLWDTQTERMLGEPLVGHTGCVMSVCFSPDGRILASGSQDRTIRLWDPHARRQLGEPLTGYTEPVTSIRFSPDGMFIIGADRLEQCIVWDARTHQKCHPPSLPPSPSTFEFQDHWLKFSSSQWLWLPAEYWDLSTAEMVLHNEKLAIANFDSISIFDLSLLL